MSIKAGGKIAHIEAPNYINEYVDQLVGITYGSGTEHRFSMTFGRDRLKISGETLTEIAPGTFQAQPTEDDYTLARVDFATLSMNIESAVRFRDALTQMIDVAQAANPKSS